MTDITDTVNDVCIMLMCPVQKVTVCTGHYFYVRTSACPVQIRAHHHIDVYTDINNPAHVDNEN